MPRELVEQVGTEVALGRGAGHDQTGRQRDQQRRDLRDEAVADGQQAVRLDRLAERHVLLQDADREAADEVDGDDDDGGDRVALDELRRTVHRAVEVGLFGDLLAAALRFVLVDDAGVEVGVDRHLLAGHRVEGEARGHLGDASGTVRDHDELDHDEDEEDDEADDHRTADDEVAEGFDDLARVAVQQHEPRDRHVEREPEQRRDQQVRREDREVEDTRRVNIDTSNASVASAMFVTRSRSRSAVGNGTTIITTMPTIAAGIAIWPMRLVVTDAPEHWFARRPWPDLRVSDRPARRPS